MVVTDHILMLLNYSLYTAGVAPPSFLFIRAGTTLYELTTATSHISWFSIGSYTSHPVSDLHITSIVQEETERKIRLMQ